MKDHNGVNVFVCVYYFACMSLGVESETKTPLDKIFFSIIVTGTQYPFTTFDVQY